MELGHFTPGPSGDGDADDAPCFSGPTLAGCIGADTDFDGTSYRRDWPDGTRMNATSIAISSVAGGGIGPLSISDESGAYDQPFPIVQFQTDVSASEAACQPNGVGCVVPPVGAQFYPFFALARDQSDNRGGERGQLRPVVRKLQRSRNREFRRRCSIWRAELGPLLRPEHQRTGQQSVPPAGPRGLAERVRRHRRSSGAAKRWI